MPLGIDGSENKIYCYCLPPATWECYHRIMRPMRPWSLPYLHTSYISKGPGVYTSVGNIACSFADASIVHVALSLPGFCPEAHSIGNVRKVYIYIWDVDIYTEPDIPGGIGNRGSCQDHAAA